MLEISSQVTNTIIALYRKGHGLNRIAVEVGCSPQVVRRVLVDNGVEIREPGRPRRESDDVLIAAYRKNGSLNAAAKATGYTSAGLAYRLDIANEISPRRPGGAPLDPAAVLDRARPRGAPEECWEAKGSSTADGYVLLKVGRRPVYAHRLSWELHNRRGIPEGWLVMHTCDNPACANPRHLDVGTHKENTHQMMIRGRCGRAKLSVVDVHQIRARAANGETAKDIAPDYPVGLLQIQRIIDRKAWRDV